MCREDVESDKLTVNKALLEEIKDNFKDDYEESLQRLKQLKIEDEKKLKVTIRYGNHHSLIRNPAKSLNSDNYNRHKWTAYVKIIDDELNDEDLIDSVIFELDESFENPIRKRSEPPFELTMKGWGSFSIPITINWKKSLKLEPTFLNHALIFENGGDSNHYHIRVNKDNIEKFNKRKIKEESKSKPAKPQKEIMPRIPPKPKTAAIKPIGKYAKIQQFKPFI